MESTGAEYTIVDHMVTMGNMMDPVDLLEQEISIRRMFGQTYFKWQLPYYKPFKRFWAEDGLSGYTSGLEEDKDRMRVEHQLRINTTPTGYMACFTPAEVHEISGVVVSNPELWGSKLKEYKELTGREYEKNV